MSLLDPVSSGELLTLFVHGRKRPVSEHRPMGLGPRSVVGKAKLLEPPDPLLNTDAVPKLLIYGFKMHRIKDRRVVFYDLPTTNRPP